MTLTISARQPAQNGSSPASQRGRVASNPRILALHYYIGRVGETRAANGASTPVEEKVGKTLIDEGFITQEQLTLARNKSKPNGASLLDCLVDYGIISQETVTSVLSFRLRQASPNLKRVRAEQGTVLPVPGESARWDGMLPIRSIPYGALSVALNVPQDIRTAALL